MDSYEVAQLVDSLKLSENNAASASEAEINPALRSSPLEKRGKGDDVHSVLEEDQVETEARASAVKSPQGGPRLDGETITKKEIKRRFHEIALHTNAGEGRAFPASKPSDAYCSILEKLGLCQYYPSKIGVIDAVKVRRDFTAMHEVTPTDLPWEILRQTLLTNYNARDKLVHAVNQSSATDKDEDSTLDMEDLLGIEVSQANEDGKCDVKLNTLDVLVVLFGCCDNFLRQVIAEKLFACKLAVPLLYPTGDPSVAIMSLWALRSTKFDTSDGDDGPPETPITDRLLPIVSFVRLGRPPLSKSKLINCVLRDDGHNTFAHFDCPNGTVEKRVADGLVECSWFLESGKKFTLQSGEMLPCTTMLLNLRGDASFHGKHLKVLNALSSVVVVVVSTQDLVEEKHADTYREISEAATKVILLLVSGSCGQSREHFNAELQACTNAVGKQFLAKSKLISSRTKQGYPRSTDDLKRDIRKYLSKTLPGGEKTMEECARVAVKIEGINIDEDESACLRGKEMAKMVLSYIDYRSDLLPLQGTNWLEYCKLLKELYTTSNSDRFCDKKVMEEMKKRREAQANQYHRLAPFMKTFIEALRLYGDEEIVVAYYLQWMTLLLDKKCREVLPNLDRRRNTILSENCTEKEKEAQLLQTAQKKKKTVDAHELQKTEEQIKGLNIELGNLLCQQESALLGLEHIFRELGQIYEAVTETYGADEDIQAEVAFLPEIAARRLLTGHSLELVDGDADSVPIKWINAVWENLGQLTGDKTLFVISVLGLQSSGKSTFLNIMFGLQFAVRAGRCTRGAFMQLVPVDPSASLPFDYIVVIDTEGLHAPELGKKCDQSSRDNKLATLVTGLSDVTIMNIKGEVTTKVDDILQIVVHALLRMKLADKHLTNKSCLFVHQNVSAVNAPTLMTKGYRALEEKLDAATQEAAEMENKLIYRRFSHVIKFNVQDHVFCCTGPWQGDPPMAPANPGYSASADAVKTILLQRTIKDPTALLTVSDFIARVKDLWRGVLADDFVFSFHNSLEIKALNGLEKVVSDLKCNQKHAISTWLLEQKSQLGKKETEKDLHTCYSDLRMKFDKKVDEEMKEARNKAEEYCKKSKLRHYLSAGKVDQLQDLDNAGERHRKQGHRTLRTEMESWQRDLQQLVIVDDCLRMIKHEAAELFNLQKDKGVVGTKDQDEMFEEIWSSIEDQYLSEAQSIVAIRQKINGILENKFQAHRDLLKRELALRPLSRNFEDNVSLLTSVSQDFISEEHIDVEKKSFLSSLTVPRQSERRSLNLQADAWKCTVSVLADASEYLKGTELLDVRFQASQGEEILEILKERIKRHNSTDSSKYTLTPNYEVKLAVHIACYCVQKFHEMECKFEKKHGKLATVQKSKAKARNYFKNVLSKNEILIIAGLFCDNLTKKVEQSTTEYVAVELKKTFLKEGVRSKKELVVGVMRDLTEREKFSPLSNYLKNPEDQCWPWINTEMKKMMFSSTPGSSELSMYLKVAKFHIQEKMQSIRDSVQAATKKANEEKWTCQQWIEEFCKNVELGVSPSFFRQMIDCGIKDLAAMQERILSQLDDTEADLVKTFTEHTDTSLDWSDCAQEILEDLLGCSAKCPFCNEFCVFTTKNHTAKHKCYQHRPRGLAGNRWGYYRLWPSYQDTLLTDTCNYLVYSGGEFSCESCGFACQQADPPCPGKKMHKYCEYSEYIPNWDIPTDSKNRCSKYWMWFMNAFKEQLASSFQAKEPVLPNAWNQVTKTDALKSLESIMEEPSAS